MPNPALAQPTSTRKINPRVQLRLAALSAGRCQFDGCNSFLLVHHVTGSWGTFGEHAHIVAFSKDGPRGDSPRRPVDINDVGNLMMLCPTCHKLIDDNPAAYTVDVLRQHKTAHEERVRHVTALAPDRKTTVISAVSMVRGQRVEVSFSEMVQAVAPYYPSTHRPHQIDLSQYPESPESYRLARETIHNRVSSLLGASSDFPDTKHVSLFALARISNLVTLGHCIGNKVAVQLYQRHRQSNSWCWESEGDQLHFETIVRATGRESGAVALLISISGEIDASMLPGSVLADHTIYEIRPTTEAPSVNLLQRRSDLTSFRSEFRKALALIQQQHGTLEVLHVFPAVPASVAVACGQDLLKGVDPSIQVNELESQRFSPGVFINNN